MEIWETPPTILIISIILTWGIGLSVPVLIRYVFLRRPINKSPAIVIVVILFFLQLFMWIGLGSTNKSHFVLVLIAYVSYEILRKHNKGEYEVIKDRDDVEFLVKSNIATEEVFEHESKTKKDSDYDEAYKKALYFIDKEGYDKALPYLELAVKTDVLSLKENVYVNIGFCYGNLGNHVKAIEAYKHAIRINPEYASAYYNLGTAYNSLSLYEDAIEACKQAIRIDPDFANAHLNLGFSCLQIGDKSSALNEYKILKNLDIDKANKLFDLIYK
jgi:tetratricopeptide (TPR) repeat protein